MSGLDELNDQSARDTAAMNAQVQAAFRQMAYSSRSGPSGVETPIGNVDYPGESVCGLSFGAWAQRAKENGGFVPASLVGFSPSVYGESARDTYCRKVRAAGGNPSPEANAGAMLGSLAGLAQHNPQKTFTRAEVLAVLRSRKVNPDNRPGFVAADLELSALISIFERLE